MTTVPAGSPDARAHVRIVGTGLVGTSLGLALSRRGYRVSLHDASPTAAALARDLGAGELAKDVGEAVPPWLVVVAAPPDVAAEVVRTELAAWPTAYVTDVASVKGPVLEALRANGLDAATLSRYAGSHPLAGRERSGAVAAQADLFEGRSWVVAAGPEASPEAVRAVRDVAEAAGAAVSRMTPEDHDNAVAAVSHVPQIAASLVAGRLRDLADNAVALAGQGVRDVTRIAASDPVLWTQILAANAPAVRAVLESLQEELVGVVQALRDLEPRGEGAPPAAVGARAVLARAVADGNAGQARIPGKHGAPPTAYATVVVLVPDEPGALGRLLRDVGDAGINLEDFHLEHAVGQAVGLAELAVLPTRVEPLVEALTRLEWRVHLES